MGLILVSININRRIKDHAIEHVTKIKEKKEKEQKNKKTNIYRYKKQEIPKLSSFLYRAETSDAYESDKKRICVEHMFLPIGSLIIIASIIYGSILLRNVYDNQSHEIDKTLHSYETKFNKYLTTENLYLKDSINVLNTNIKNIQRQYDSIKKINTTYPKQKNSSTTPIPRAINTANKH